MSAIPMISRRTSSKAATPLATRVALRQGRSSWWIGGAEISKGAGRDSPRAVRFLLGETTRRVGRYRCARLSIPKLIGLNVLLILLAVVGFVQAAAKDRVTTTEGIIFWASVLAFPVLLVALAVLLIIGVKRLLSRSVRSA
jgi:hypothetical protein